MTKRLLMFALAAVLLAAGGCKPKAKEITSLQRKEAAHLVSEAEFALTLRDWARAEGLLLKATELCPDTGDYWVNLGSTRVRLGNRAGGKAAYQSALAAYEGAYRLDAKEPGALLQQVYVLALLGRADDARAILESAQKKHPDHRTVRGFAEAHQLDRILADPQFKAISL